MDALTLRRRTVRPPVQFLFKSLRSYRPAEGRVEAMRRQRPGPPPATTNRLLAEPGGGPWVNCAWVEVSRGRFVGGRIVKSKHRILSILSWGKLSAAQYKSVNSCHNSSLHSSLVCKISGGSWGSIRIIWASSLEDFPQSPYSLRLFCTKSVYVLKPSPTTRRTNAVCVSLLRYTASLGTVQYCTELVSVYSIKQLCNVQYLLYCNCFSRLFYPSGSGIMVVWALLTNQLQNK